MSRSRQTTRKVQFDKLTSVRISCDYSQDEIRSYWYDKDEYMMMRRSVVMHTNMFSQTFTERNSNNVCSIGLSTYQYKKERRKRVRQALLAVLVKQQTQWDEGIDLTDDICAVLAEYSRCALLLARERGLSLARELHPEGNDEFAANRKPLSICNIRQSTGGVTASPISIKLVTITMENQYSRHSNPHSMTPPVLSILPE